MRWITTLSASARCARTDKVVIQRGGRARCARNERSALAPHWIATLSANARVARVADSVAIQRTLL